MCEKYIPYQHLRHVWSIWFLSPKLLILSNSTAFESATSRKREKERGGGGGVNVEIQLWEKLIKVFARILVYLRTSGTSLTCSCKCHACRVLCAISGTSSMLHVYMHKYGFWLLTNIISLKFGYFFKYCRLTWIKWLHICWG